MHDIYTQQQLKKLAGQYKLTPATLAFKLNPRWIPAAHLMYISSKVAQGIAKGNARIIVSLPFRHGKSELITKYTTTWVLELYSHWNIILATYGAELSTDFGRKVRDIIKENRDLLDVTIRPDAERVAAWRTDQGGGMYSVGIGGAITGRGANVFLIDDYFKDIKEAMSQANRDAVYDWFRTVARTRVEPGGSIVIIATRWHPDDLIGRILENDRDKGRWDYIRIPGIAEEDDILGRLPGEALFPERYPLEVLQELKQEMGSFFFNAMVQQDPQSNEDALTNVDWLKVIDEMPDLTHLKLARAWDLAASENAGDYTAGALLGLDEERGLVYILDIIKEQLSPTNVEVTARRTALRDGTRTGIYIEQEPGSSGKHLIHHFKTNVLSGFNVKALPTSGSKLARAQPFLAGCEAGRVLLVRGKWNKAFISEFKEFPGGKHDDQMDAVSGAYNALTGKKATSVSWGRHSNESKAIIKPTLGEIVEISKQRSKVVFGRHK